MQNITRLLLLSMPMWTIQELRLGHTEELGHRASMSKTTALPIAASPSRHPIYSLPVSPGIWNIAHLGNSAGHCDPFAPIVPENLLFPLFSFPHPYIGSLISRIN